MDQKTFSDAIVVVKTMAYLNKLNSCLEAVLFIES